MWRLVLAGGWEKSLPLRPAMDLSNTKTISSNFSEVANHLYDQILL